MLSRVACIASVILTGGCSPATNLARHPTSMTTTREVRTVSHTTEGKPETPRTDEDWKKKLTPEQYHVLREKGTERPFTGKFWNSHEDGTYRCAACGQVLFGSAAKFDSGCGWPSFWKAADRGAVRFQEDNSHGMRRTEVLCSRCGGHLGHIFDDGPDPTGKRYCINSVSLEFEPKKP